MRHSRSKQLLATQQLAEGAERLLGEDEPAPPDSAWVQGQVALYTAMGSRLWWAGLALLLGSTAVFAITVYNVLAPR